MRKKLVHVRMCTSFVARDKNVIVVRTSGSPGSSARHAGFGERSDFPTVSAGHCRAVPIGALEARDLTQLAGSLRRILGRPPGEPFPSFLPSW